MNFTTFDQGRKGLKGQSFSELCENVFRAHVGGRALVGSSPLLCVWNSEGSVMQERRAGLVLLFILTSKYEQFTCWAAMAFIPFKYGPTASPYAQQNCCDLYRLFKVRCHLFWISLYTYFLSFAADATWELLQTGWSCWVGFWVQKHICQFNPKVFSTAKSLIAYWCLCHPSDTFLACFAPGGLHLLAHLLNAIPDSGRK